MRIHDLVLKKSVFLRHKRVGVMLGVLLLLGLAVWVLVSKGEGAKATERSLQNKSETALEFADSDIAWVVQLSLARTILMTGSLVPVTQASVKTTVAGEVQRVLVREGESVRRGALLAEIDVTDARSRLAAALADQAERRAKLDIAARNRDTNQSLLQKNFISQNAFDQLHSTYQASFAALQWADAQVDLARKAIGDAQVRAPIDGVVARRFVNGGERVAVDTPMVNLVDLSRMELEASVGAQDVASMAPGQTVQFSFEGFGQRQFAGQVVRINPLTEPGSRAVKVFVAVPNGDAALRGGMFAQGAVTVAHAELAPVVPLSAVFEEAGQSYVFSIESGKLAKRAIQLGFRDDARGLAEVANGLAAGVPVVRIRMNGLKDGAPALLRDVSAPKAASQPA